MTIDQPATLMPVDLGPSVHSSERPQVDFTYGRPNYAVIICCRQWYRGDAKSLAGSRKNAFSPSLH